MSTTEPPSVLIVDDNEDDRFLTGRLLDTIGFARPYATAKSAAVAMEMLLDGVSKFQVALLDVRMPLMDGLELLRWIRARHEFDAMKIVMLTSSDDAHDITRAREWGANGYLLKQDSPEKCASILAHLVPELSHQMDRCMDVTANHPARRRHKEQHR